MNKLKGKRRKDASGRWYTSTPYGKIYDRISKDRLMCGGFHSSGGYKHGRRDD